MTSRSGWLPESEHQRFLSALAGDPRQLWARDTRLNADADLFFLERGCAEEVRAKGWVPGILECPFPNCPYPRFKTTAGGEKRRDHFRHERDPELAHTDAAALAYLGVHVVRQWLRERSYASVVIEKIPQVEGVERARLLRTWGPELTFFAAGRPLDENELAQSIHGLPVGSPMIWVLMATKDLLAQHSRDRLVSRFAARLARDGRSLFWLNANEQLLASPIGDPSIPFKIKIFELRDASLTRTGISSSSSPSGSPIPSSVDDGSKAVAGLAGADALRAYLEWTWGRPDRALGMFEAIHAAFPEDVEFRGHYENCLRMRRWTPITHRSSNGASRLPTEQEPTSCNKASAPVRDTDERMFEAVGLDLSFRIPGRQDGLRAVRGYLQWMWAGAGRSRRAVNWIVDSVPTPRFRLLAADHMSVTGHDGDALAQLDAAGKAFAAMDRDDAMVNLSDHRAEIDRRRIALLLRIGRGGDAWAQAQAAVMRAPTPASLVGLRPTIETAAEHRRAALSADGTPEARKRFRAEFDRVMKRLGVSTTFGQAATADTARRTPPGSSAPSNGTVTKAAAETPERWDETRISTWMLVLLQWCPIEELGRRLGETQARAETVLPVLVDEHLVEVSSDGTAVRCARRARRSQDWLKKLRHSA